MNADNNGRADASAEFEAVKAELATRAPALVNPAKNG